MSRAGVELDSDFHPKPSPGVDPPLRPHCPAGPRPDAVPARGGPHPRGLHPDAEAATASGGAAAISPRLAQARQLLSHSTPPGPQLLLWSPEMEVASSLLAAASAFYSSLEHGQE